MRVYYRLLQTWHTITRKPLSDDLSEIQSVLSPGLYTLFVQMHPSEQAHSIAVYRHLSNQDIQNKDLLEAALLHDVGKNQHTLSILERIAIVLGNTIFPQKTKLWSTGKPEGWKRPFVVARKHPEWGADLALQAGASKITADLIRRHQDSILYTSDMIINLQDRSSNSDLTEAELLYMLQRSDNIN
ncbi:MAG: HD domain-containing protein [Anaerolineales bacterium]|jgi:hypothetical protein